MSRFNGRNCTRKAGEFVDKFTNNISAIFNNGIPTLLIFNYELIQPFEKWEDSAK
jgi:hypothetical protein